MKKLLNLCSLFIVCILYSQASSKINNAQNVTVSVPTPDNLIAAEGLPLGGWIKMRFADIRFNTNQITGLDTFIQNTGNVLWQPLLGYTPVASNRIITINGITYDLSADRVWNIPFSSLAGKPTNLAGYGITDAYPLIGNPSGFINSIPAQTWESITGKPSFSTVANTGNYSDLLNKPNIYNFTGLSTQYTKGDGTYAIFPTSLSAFNNDSGFVNSTSLSTTLNSYTTNAALNTALAGKENNITSGTVSQYFRGDKTFQTLNTTAVTEGLNLYYTDARARVSLSAGTGIGYNSSTGVITNSSPDRTVTITGTGSTTVTGTYPNFTITSSTSKRQLTYSGVTDASGNYTVTFPQAFTVSPNVQVNPIGGNVLYRTVTTVTPTGFTVNISTQNTAVVALVSVLLPGVTAVNGANVDVLITEK